MGGGEVVQFGDVGDGEPIAVAEEEEGCGDTFGVEAAVGGDVEDAVVVEVGLEALGGEGFVELDFAGVDASVAVLDDRVEFGFDVGEGAESGVRVGGAKGEDGGRSSLYGEAIGHVAVGGDDVGEGVALGEVLFSVVECGDGDVAGDVIEGEDELLFWVLSEFGLELGWDEPVVEFCAGGFECVEVAVGGADLLTKFCDGFVELLLGDVGDDDRFCVAICVGPENPEFVIDD